jgi:hypothetical protein
VSGDPPTIERDAHGFAKGGVRLPDVEVPISSNSGYNAGAGLEALVGSAQPFGHEKIKMLYPTHETYVAKVTAAATAAREVGVILSHAESDYIQKSKDRLSRRDRLTSRNSQCHFWGLNWFEVLDDRVVTILGSKCIKGVLR